MSGILEPLVGSLLSGSAIAAILGYLLHHRAKSIEERLRVGAETLLTEYRSRRQWKEAALSKVLGPTYMHLERTRRAFKRWKQKQIFLEMEVIGTSNRCVRDLLLENGHLIPEHLLDHAAALIHHYDAWLEEFHRQRERQQPDLGTTFVFVGPQGYGFPGASEAAFKACFHDFRRDLYGDAAPTGTEAGDG